MKKYKRKKLIMAWLAVILCMLAIYLLSAQPAVVSNSASKGIVKHVVETTIKITKAEITEPKKWQIINNINSVAREYICVVYGIIDEIHQLFVSGRAFQLSDLIMDTVGSIIGIAIYISIHTSKKMVVCLKFN